MTSSQQTSRAALAVAILGAVLAALTPYVAALPEPWTIIAGAVMAAGGAAVAAFNQSLASGHVSIPVATAKRAGVAKKQTKETE